MEKYLLGIDIGTSGCKIAFFRKNGEVVATNTKEYPVYYKQPGYAEQDPMQWWEAVSEGIKETLQQYHIPPENIAGIGVDGQSWSAIPVDIKGNVLANTPIWMDTRAQEICDRLQKKIGKENIFSLGGNQLQPSYTTGKIIWFQENMPEVYANIHKILQSNSFIVYKLTRKYSQDKSQGYGLHCFDMKKGIWDEDMCNALGIPMDFLPSIYECHEIVGYVTKEAAQKTGLLEGTPVVAGGLDAACGTLGAGVIHSGETQEQGGQAGGMSICMSKYLADPRLILGFHVVPDLWLLQGGTTGGGGVMRWMEREFGDYEREKVEEIKKSPLEQFNDLVENVKPGCEGVVFLPYMSGERSPIWDIHAKGVFYGLDFSKTKGHMIRAGMEGVAFSLKHNLNVAKEAGASIEVLRAMGGSANSIAWTQMKADITGKSIIVPASDTATTLGAALLAGVGVGMYSDFEEAVALTVQIRREHTPNLDNYKIYEKNYNTYLKLYENLKETMKEEF